MGRRDMTHARRFVREGEQAAAKPYHYRACGLDDVYLLSGFERKETAYGPTTFIHDVPGLHRAIGLNLTESPKPLSPREFRFLRKNMNLTQEHLAKRLRVDAQTVARYEKDQTSIPGATDTVLRMMFLLFACSKEERDELLAYIRELLEEKRNESAAATDKSFSFTPDRGWSEGIRLH